MNDIKKSMQELQNLIEPYCDDYEYILGVLSFTDHPDDREKMKAFIQSGINVNVETIMNCAVNLYDRRVTK